VVWDAVRKDIPELKSLIKALIERLGWKSADKNLHQEL
jgi:hypothetical protein